jgi:ketosteroid isomerase-like protein
VAEFFPYAVDARLAPFWLPYGLCPSKDGVTITDDGTFRATYGLFPAVETSLHNIDDAHVTRGYRWWTAAGARRSFADDGLTFGTNRAAGVCVHFREPVRSLLGPAGHSAITVTVADVEGLADRLQSGAMTNSDRVALLRRAYGLFNDRQIDELLELMTDDVEWPDVANRTVLQGKNAIRPYWAAQFEVADPRVEPVDFIEAGDDLVAVVDQRVQDLQGQTIAGPTVVYHRYRFAGDLVSGMTAFNEGSDALMSS